MDKLRSRNNLPFAHKTTIKSQISIKYRQRNKDILDMMNTPDKINLNNMKILDQPLFLFRPDISDLETKNLPLKNPKNEGNVNINSNKTCKVSSIYNALREFAMIHLNSQRILDDFFSQKALKIYIENTPRIEFNKCKEFIKEMVLVKSEMEKRRKNKESSIKLLLKTKFAKHKSIIYNRNKTHLSKYSTHLDSSNKIEFEDAKMIKNKNAVTPLLPRFIKLARNGVEGTKKSINLIVNACDAINYRFDRTIKKVVHAKRSISRNTKTLMMEFEGRAAETSAQNEMRRLLLKNIKNRRCFIYGKKGHGKFLSGTIQKFNKHIDMNNF